MHLCSAIRHTQIRDIGATKSRTDRVLTSLSNRLLFPLSNTLHSVYAFVIANPSVRLSVWCLSGNEATI